LFPLFAFGFLEKVEAAAYISPLSQTIYGSQAPAIWNFSWSGTSPFKIYFRTDTTNGYTLINARSTSLSMSYQREYSSSASYVSYTPGLLVEDNNGHLQVASAKVYKYLTRP